MEQLMFLAALCKGSCNPCSHPMNYGPPMRFGETSVPRAYTVLVFASGGSRNTGPPPPITRNVIMTETIHVSTTSAVKVIVSE